MQACRGGKVDIGHPLDGNKNVGQDQNNGKRRLSWHQIQFEQTILFFVNNKKSNQIQNLKARVRFELTILCYMTVFRQALIVTLFTY